MPCVKLIKAHAIIGIMAHATQLPGLSEISEWLTESPPPPASFTESR